MKDKHKKGNVKKHRGNPHGNAPQSPRTRKGTAEDNLDTENPGVSKSSRMKQ